MIETSAQLAMLRLQHQHIHAANLQKPVEVARHMGALQAQDYDMAKWAIGLRIEQGSEAAVEEALSKGELIRSHLLRPTWHIVAADDYRWILELSAPQLKKVAASYNKQVGLDEATLKKSYKLISKLLQQQQHLTRDEIMQVLRKSSIETDTLRSAHIMFHAELNGLVCQGVRNGKQLTYALLDERISKSTSLTREESLVRLALIYFTSHAPATMQDFSWWSGLSKGDARKAIDLTGSALNRMVFENNTYYFTQNDLVLNTHQKSIFMLPAFDEFLVGYADRSASLAKEFNRQVITVNGIFKPTIIIDGKVAGVWKRMTKPTHIVIEIIPFGKPNKQMKQNIKERFIEYGLYSNQTELKFV